MSLTELTLILFVALVLFGPEDLPDVARALGKMVYKAKKIASEVSREFQETIETPSKVVNDALKEQPKSKKEKQENQDPSPLEEEELLTYEEDEPQKVEGEATDHQNPLADLPADVVAYSKDEQAGD